MEGAETAKIALYLQFKYDALRDILHLPGSMGCNLLHCKPFAPIY